jgi:hypothetical protein
MSASDRAGASPAGAIGAATAVTLPLVAVGTVVANLHSKHKIDAEFARRRLALPLTLAPGQTVQGSLFFRITPGPHRLALHGRAADQPCDVTLPLTPLAGLHLAPPAPAPRRPRWRLLPRPQAPAILESLTDHACHHELVFRLEPLCPA